jgi:hypothetical protein
VTAWSIDGDDVTLHLSGPDTPGDTAVLASDLAAAFGAPVAVEVNYVAESRSRATAAP